ncbi:MAG: hypothetical protein LUG44_00920 [Clostridiales bacterium]|nr:hypothetical protein [Clostridiales bacterium]
MAKIEDWLTEVRLRKLAGWRREGRSEEEIAEKIGISARALARWKKRDERFRRALEVDPEAVDFQVHKIHLSPKKAQKLRKSKKQCW